MMEFPFVDGVSQAELVRRKELTARELVEAAIARIERFNPALNAVVTSLYDAALSAAEQPIGSGPLAGVPFLLKDLLASYGGAKTTCGSKFLRDFVCDHDSELVKRLKRAGLIIIGKTNTAEFGLLPTTEPELFGPTLNPWDPTRTPGGSSGGAAAAVAGGLVPLAHGNDGGGSIRIPASCCGVFGIKPTRARNPLGPDFGDIMNGLVVEHALTRSVRDSAALLDVTAGPDLGDPYCTPPLERPLLEEVGRDPGRLRIAFTAICGETRAHPDCVRALHDCAGVLARLGHEVEEDAPSFDRRSFRQAFNIVWATGCAKSIKGAVRAVGRTPMEEELEPFTRALYELGKEQTASAYLQAVERLQRIARKVAGFFVDYDVLLTPTLAEPPVPLKTFAVTAEDPLAVIDRAWNFAPFTALANATGQPAMSVPLFWNDTGLPIGSHFLGRFGEEGKLFRLGSQLEAEKPWAKKTPAVL